MRRTAKSAGLSPFLTRYLALGSIFRSQACPAPTLPPKPRDRAVRRISKRRNRMTCEGVVGLRCKNHKGEGDGHAHGTPDRVDGRGTGSLGPALLRPAAGGRLALRFGQGSQWGYGGRSGSQSSAKAERTCSTREQTPSRIATSWPGSALREPPLSACNDACGRQVASRPLLRFIPG
jgi:hypothetical protein